MKTILATIGAGFSLLMLLGALGIGHFAVYYGPDESVRCVAQEGKAS
jgi:hypothetical protein